MISFVLALLLADAPPPAPAPVVTAPWACDRRTLLRGVPCTLEGRSRSSTGERPTQEQAQENLAAARTLGLSLCRTVAGIVDGGAPSRDAVSIEQRCARRLDRALSACASGDRRLLDDDGRFNPGHAACYAALHDVVRATADLRAEADRCCGCLSDARGNDIVGCVAALDDDKLPSGAADKPCAASCATILLRAPSTTKK